MLSKILPMILEHDGVKEFIGKQQVFEWMNSGKHICNKCKYINCLCDWK